MVLVDFTTIKSTSLKSICQTVLELIKTKVKINVARVKGSFAVHCTPHSYSSLGAYIPSLK